MGNKVKTQEDKSILAARCALADLIGAWQDWHQRGSPDSVHDWSAHVESIIELAEAFDLMSEVPAELQ